MNQIVEEKIKKKNSKNKEKQSEYMIKMYVKQNPQNPLTVALELVDFVFGDSDYDWRKLLFTSNRSEDMPENP